MPAIQIPNGLNIFYREHGSGERVILFIHGNTASSLWWERTMANLPAGYRAVAPDLRGCGDSAKAEGAWGLMADIAGDIYEVTNALGITRCAVVGHSFGGSVALQLAVDHPELVEKLVMINAAPADGLQLPEAHYTNLEAVVKLPQVLKGALGAMMPTAPKDEYYERLLEESVTKSAGALIPNGRTLHVFNVVEQAGRLAVPTLVLYGKQDMLVTLAMAEKTQQQIPGATLEVWDEVGHSMMVEAPERFARRIVEFIG